MNGVGSNPFTNYQVNTSEEENLPPTQPLSDDNVEDSIDPHLEKLFDGIGTVPLRECNLFTEENFEIKVEKEKDRITGQIERDRHTYDAFRRQYEGIQKNTKKRKAIASFDPCYCMHEVKEEDRFHSFTTTIRTETGQKEASFFCVFDGHGGDQASQYCVTSIQTHVNACMKELNTDGKDFSIGNALRIAIVRLDKTFQLNDHKYPGSTVCLSMIVNGKLFIANCGDSRAMLHVGGKEPTLQLSFDYKANDEVAQQTTFHRNGKIKKNRVSGCLAVTRAIGDDFLKPFVSPRPKITLYKLSDHVVDEDSSCLVLCSDGLTDVASTEQIGLAIQNMQKQGYSYQEVCENLVKFARKAGSKDDITVGIVPLKDFIE